MNTTVTFNPNTLNSNTVTRRPIVNITAASLGRTFARKWDLIGVIALMLSSAAYGIYALTYLTGF